MRVIQARRAAIQAHENARKAQAKAFACNIQAADRLAANIKSMRVELVGPFDLFETNVVKAIDNGVESEEFCFESFFGL